MKSIDEYQSGSMESLRVIQIFRELTVSNGPELLEGMLHVDVVGFHSFDNARHFLNTCKRFLGLSYESRRGGNLGVDYRGRNVVVKKLQEHLNDLID